MFVTVDLQSISHKKLIGMFLMSTLNNINEWWKTAVYANKQ